MGAGAPDSTVDEGGRVAQKAAVSSGSQFGYMVVLTVLNMASYLAIIRYLSKASFGDYALVTVVNGLVALIANSNLDRLAVREIAQGEDEDRVLGNIVTARLMLSVGCVALGQVVYLLIGLKRGEVVGAVHLAGLIASGLYFAETLFTTVAVFRARLRQEFETLARLVAVLVKTAAIFLLIALEAPMWAFLAGATIGELTGGFICTRIARRRFHTRIRLRTDRLRWVFRETVPLCLSLVLGGGFIFFDTIFLGAMRSAEEVATYSVAVTIVAYTLAISSFVGIVSYPLLCARWGEGDKRRFNSVNQATFDLAIGAFIPFAVVCSTVDLAPMLGAVLGEEYRASAVPLRLLAVSIGMLTVIHWQDFVLLAVGRIKERSWLSVFTLSLTVVFNVALIPSHGVAGAGWAAVLSTSIAMPVSLYMTRRLAGTAPMWGRSARVVLANVALGGTILLLRSVDVPSFVAALVAVAAVYPLVLLALRVVSPKHLAELWAEHAAAEDGAGGASRPVPEPV